MLLLYPAVGRVYTRWFCQWAGIWRVRRENGRNLRAINYKRTLFVVVIGLCNLISTRLPYLSFLVLLSTTSVGYPLTHGSIYHGTRLISQSRIISPARVTGSCPCVSDFLPHSVRPCPLCISDEKWMWFMWWLLLPPGLCPPISTWSGVYRSAVLLL